MARFLLSAMPFTGHVRPMLAVAEALAARGHDVRLYTGAAFAAAVEASGARLVPWRTAPDFDENDLAATFPRLEGRKGLRQLLVNIEDVFIRTSPAQVEDLRAEAEREPWDAMAGDEMSIGIAQYAELAGAPCATVTVLPLNLAGPQGPPSGLGLAPGTNPLTQARDALLRAAVPLISRSLKKPIAAARAAVGLAPTKLTLDRLAFSPQLVVATGVPSLDFGRTDRPAHLHFVGRLEPASAPSSELPRWWHDLDDRRIVHVTQGTQNIDPADLIRPAIKALEGRDVLVVVTTGVRGRDELPFAVPANVRAAGFVPYDALLPRVETMITNGGWGGTLGALAHGIPLVIAGGDLDKPEIAARVAWSGAGVDLRTGTPTAAQVAAGYERATDASYRASAGRVAAELSEAGGAPRAAVLLERLLGA